jgi:methylase of polypeptide subunit release factors
MPHQSPTQEHTHPEFSPATLDFLTSPQAAQALAQLDSAAITPGNELHLLMILRQTFSREQAAALLIQARLRQRASRKFADADRLLFTTEALEQATAQAIADYRAGWIHRHAPPGPILDLGCGIGGDSLALARHRPVIAYEIAAERLHLAQANAAALGLAHRITFRLADWTVDLA